MNFTTNLPAAARLREKLLPCLVLLLLLNGPGPLLAQPVHLTPNGSGVDRTFLNEEIEKLMEELRVPAASVAIIEDNKIVFSNAYGYKEAGRRHKVDGKTVFEACSLSKSFLVFVAHQMVDEGKLDLDKPIHQYLEYDALKHDPRYKLITPRMILNHSSGMENWRWFNVSDTLEILSAPGERYIYSGEGYNYLAEAMGLILNQSYEQFVNERIIAPLRLKNTYLKYTEKSGNPFHKGLPWNYAVGHDSFGDQFDKWKNEDPVPSSGYHLVAEDYAKLILSIFDKKNLSENRIKDLLSPGVRLVEDDPTLYFGPGFELIYTGNDTIVAHGGSNPGFKSNLFYSVASGRGFVFLTNSDRGKLMAARLNELSARLDLGAYFRKDDYEQFPSVASHLFTVYLDKDFAGMFEALEKLKKEKKIGVNALNELSEVFMERDHSVSKKLLEENLVLHPESGRTYYLLGTLRLDLDDYDSAHQYFAKAKEFKFDPWEVERNLKECEAKMAALERDAARRAPWVVNISGTGESTLQTENYNKMKGIRLQPTSDAGGGEHVGFIHNDDWMDYRVNMAAAGAYLVAFRIASADGGGQIQLRSGNSTLATVEVPATNGWSDWTTITTRVVLPAGSQTLNVYAGTGGFSLNWMRFSPGETSAGNTRSPGQHP